MNASLLDAAVSSPSVPSAGVAQAVRAIDDGIPPFQPPTSRGSFLTWSPWPNPSPVAVPVAAPGGVCGGPKAICPDPPLQDRAIGSTALSWGGG